MRHRLAVWKEILGRPVVVAGGGVFGVLSAVALVRDDVLPAVLAQKEADAVRQHMAPAIRWCGQNWLILTLVLLLGVVLEGSFRHVRQLHVQPKSTQSQPEVMKELVGGIRKLVQLPASSNAKIEAKFTSGGDTAEIIFTPAQTFGGSGNAFNTELGM